MLLESPNRLKYSQMKLGMKREALAKMNRHANESELAKSFDTAVQA